MKTYSSLELTPAANEKVSSWAMTSHKLTRVTLPDSTKTWICKEISDPVAAKCELVAQEFFRLIIPHQPETRIAENPHTRVCYILSEEVLGYKRLPSGRSENFSNGTYTGLGQAMLTAMFVQEVDLKNGNIGLNSENQVIKIDGDRCFAYNRYIKKYMITKYSIAALPFVSDFYAFNWLDIITENTEHYCSRILGSALSTAPQFRAEVNQAILKILFLPDLFIENFIDTYMSCAGQELVNLIKFRRNLLCEAALENASFHTYLASSDAQHDLSAILEQMKSMSTPSGGIINIKHHEQLETEFNALQSSFLKAKQEESLKPSVDLKKSPLEVPQTKSAYHRFSSFVRRGFRTKQRPAEPPEKRVSSEKRTRSGTLLACHSLFAMPKKPVILVSSYSSHHQEEENALSHEYKIKLKI